MGQKYQPRAGADIQHRPADNDPRNEENISRLGEQTEPRTNGRDIQSLQPGKPLTDNAVLFSLKLFLHDQIRTQIRERCESKKDTGRRRVCSDGEVRTIIMQLNYENEHWLFAAIDLVENVGRCAILCKGHRT